VSELVLALMAHPDDEVLGCGGTLAKHVASGAEVHARFLSTGVGARNWKLVEPNDRIDMRLAEMRAAAKVLGLASVSNADSPDQRFDTIPQLDVNRIVEKWLAEIKPTIIYTHSLHDANRDHRITADAVRVATRPQAYGPCSVFGCEIVGMSDLLPDLWVRLGLEHQEAKLIALEAYGSERQDPPGPRSVWAQRVRMEARGAEAAWMWAEAFEVIRWVR